MNSRFLSSVVTSLVLASALALPSVSLAEDVTGTDAPAIAEEQTDVTDNSVSNEETPEAENAKEPVTRGGASNYRRSRTNRNHRPPSATDVNNARNRSPIWWFN